VDGTLNLLQMADALLPLTLIEKVRPPKPCAECGGVSKHLYECGPPLRKVRAEAWDQGWEVGNEHGRDDFPMSDYPLLKKTANPHRTDAGECPVSHCRRPEGHTGAHHDKSGGFA